eukprot:8126773-Lingulodinium_polyedra.AAC.1
MPWQWQCTELHSNGNDTELHSNASHSQNIVNDTELHSHGNVADPQAMTVKLIGSTALLHLNSGQGLSKPSVN